MPVLAEAAVEIKADTTNFDADLVQQLNQAGAAADRASTSIGRRIGRSLGSGLGNMRDTFNRALVRPLSEVSSTASRAGRAVSTAFAPAARSIGAVGNEIAGVRRVTSSARSAAQAFGSALQGAGQAASTAFTATRDNISLVSRGLRRVSASASESNSSFYRLGNSVADLRSRASGAFQRIRSGLSDMTAGLRRSADTSQTLASSMSRLGGVVAGLAAGAGIAELGSQIIGVANSTQTAEASMKSLYEAAGGGAREVNTLIDEMSVRFRHLDMSTMQEGATTLAYMGLQGEEAVDVLENLDNATTAAGTGAAGLSRALDAMMKGVNAGKFQMGELNQISNAGIPIYDSLADALGVSIPEAQKKASEGAIDLEDVLKGISGEFGTWFPALQEGAEDVGNTFANSWDSLKNTFVNGMAFELLPLLDRLAPALSQAADLAGDAFDRLPEALGAVTDRLGDSGAFDTLRSVMSGVGDVASSLGPLLRGMGAGASAVAGQMLDLMGSLEGAGDLLGNFASWLGENEAVLKTVGVALGGMVTTLTVWRGAAIAAAAASRLLALGVRGIGVAIRGIPLVGWVLAGVSALVALYQTSDRFREVVNNAFFRARDAVVAAWGAIQPAWDAMVDTLGNLWEAVTGWQGWQTAWQGIKDAVSGAWDVISPIWDAISEGWSDLSGALGDADTWSGAWEAFSSSVQAAWDIVQPIFDQVAEAIGFIGDLISGDAGFSDLGQVLVESFRRLQGVGQAIAEVIIAGLEQLPGLLASAGVTLGGFLIDQLRKLPGLALDALRAFGNFILDWFTSLPGRIGAAVEAAGGLLGWLAGLGTRVGERLAGVGSAVLDWFKSLPGRVRAVIEEAGGVLAFLQGIGQRVVERLQSLGASFISWFQGLPQLIRDNIDPAAILAWLRELPGRIVEFMAEYGPQLLRGFAIAMAVVVAGIPALFLGLLAAIQVVLGTIAIELLKWAAQAFTAMMQRAALAVRQGISVVVAWFQGLPGRALAAVQGFGAMLSSWGRSAFSQLRSVFFSAMSSFSSWWSGRWNSLVSSARGIWNGFVSWAGGAAGRLRDNVMGPVNRLRDRLVSAFRTARENIGKVWDGLKGKVAGPINWVISTGYGGIKSVWDKVVGKFGGSKLPGAPPTIKYATGGVFPGYTPGRDPYRVPMAAFSGGESVLRPEVTKAWGAKTTHMLNQLARSGGVRAVRRALEMLFAGQNPFTGGSVPRVSSAALGGGQAFARGGIISGPAGRAWDWLNSKGEEFGEGMMDFLDDPAGVFKKMARGVIDFSSIPNSSKAWAKLLVRIPKKIIDELAKKAKDLFSIDGDWSNVGGSVGGRLGAALAFAKSQAGKPYIWGGVGPRGYDCSGFTSAITNVILGKNPYRRRHTTFTFGGRGGDGFVRNLPSPWMIGVTNAGVGHMAGTLLGTNVESRGSRGVVVGSSARGYRSGLFNWRGGFARAARAAGGRMGGEGILYDRGGLLMPGMTLVDNRTGKPETVRTYAQEARVERLVRLMEGQLRAAAPAARAPVVRPGDEQRLARALGADRLGGTTVNAPVTVNTYAADPETVAYKTSARIARLAGL